MFGAEVTRVLHPPGTLYPGQQRITMRLGGQTVLIAPPHPHEATATPPPFPHYGLEHIGLTVDDVDAAVEEPCLIGWRGYFGFCQTPRVLTNLEAWYADAITAVRDCLTGTSKQVIPRFEIVQRDGLAVRATELGERLKRGLLSLKQRHPCIGDVRGRGLLLGLEFAALDRSEDHSARVLSNAVTDHALKLGLSANIVRTGAADGVNADSPAANGDRGRNRSRSRPAECGA